MLASNKHLYSLNIESNFITNEGMMAIVKALGSNSTLAELKIDNQVSYLSNAIIVIFYQMCVYTYKSLVYFM